MTRVLPLAWLFLAAPAAAAPATVNLLTDAPVVVAVSSTVANAKILPGHLVDGDLGTAWNSRTGDLVGAWLGVRVPAGAQVTAIRMTIGFTRVDPRLGDLFTMNPRIRKVRVLRDGVALTEHTFDPDVRTLQDIAITGGSGDYKIEVVEIVPGSRTSWHEICVSELEVRGRIQRGARPRPTRPVVRVGSFDPGPTGFASPAAYCTALLGPPRPEDAQLDYDCAHEATPSERCYLRDAGSCRVDPDSHLAAPGGRITGAAVVTTGSSWGHPSCTLLVAVRGTYHEAATVDPCGASEGGAVDLHTRTLAVRGDRLIWQYARDPLSSDEAPSSGGFECAISAAGAPQCRAAP